MGRSVDCDISLNDNHVSRVHLLVTRRWRQIWIEDKNSSNGTFVNGTRIVQGTPVNVVPTDRIQLGKSEYCMQIDVEAEELVQEPSVELPPEQEEEVIAETVAMPPPQFAQSPFQAEKLLHEAKRKAAQIILEGETQAEKRVQTIYQKAREAQAQAELFYQTRLSEAHKEADAILADFQNQGRELLQSARQMSQELREEVDLYVQGLREKARQDAENLIAETTLEAERIKVEALRQARESAEQESQLLMDNARDEVHRVLEFTRLQVQEVQEKLQVSQTQFTEVSQKLSETETHLQQRTVDLEKTETAYAELQKDMSEFRIREETKLRAHIEAEEQRLKTWSTAEESRVQELVQSAEAKNKDLEEAKRGLETQKNSLEVAVKTLQERQARLSLELKDTEAKKDHLFKEYESQKVFLNEKLEKEKSQMAKSEEQRLEEMRLDTSKKLKKMERDLIEDILRRKNELIRDIHTSVEKEVVRHMPAPQWRDISKGLEAKMMEALEGKVSHISQDAATSAPSQDVLKRRKKEKIQWMSAGLTAGLAIFFVAQILIQKIASDNTPMQTLVQREAQKRKEDLEKRKFNPAQTDELRETYMDAVLYTRNFPGLYGDEEFQQKLYRSISQYMYKTWRVEEEKTIQVLAASRALVKELQDRKAQVHPDFVKEGLQKMRDMELASLSRMKEILGTEVRVDSYRRFERNFYKEETQRRRMASH